MSKKKKITIITVSSILAALLIAGVILLIVFLGKENEPEVNVGENFIYLDFECRRVGDEIEILSYHGTASEIYVPSAIDLIPVTSIGEYAFSDSYSADDIKTVHLGVFLTTIGDFAFSECKSIKDIIF